MSGGGLIAIRELTKRFGTVCAVDNLNFDIEAGEFFAILGPSGCGKTTLLRLLAGFESPTAGEIFLGGQPLSGVSANRRPTNMVFQSYAIFPHLNVGQNIAYGLRNQNLTKAEIEAAVMEALDLIKLPGYGGRRPGQLSGGQRQRVALARALVCRPKVLLLDEPLGALDKKLREEMQLELRQLQRSVGITFVFVTHDQDEALALSDRIAVMSNGRILQIDSASKLYEAPNCREVATFIGSMNFIAGILHDHGIVDAGSLGPLRIKLDAAMAAPAPVTLAIRPEKLSLAHQPSTEPDTNNLCGRLMAQTYLGDRNLYYVAIEGLPRLMEVASQNIRRDGKTGDSVGSIVWVTWPSDSGVLLFA